MKTFKGIQIGLTVALALLSVGSLVAGIVTGGWHLYVIAGCAALLMRALNEESQPPKPSASATLSDRDKGLKEQN